MNITSIRRPFANRRDAGQRLAAVLAEYKDLEGLVILALPRGGVPVAAEIATALDKPFDLLIVRKLGVPGHEEMAMGARYGSDPQNYGMMVAVGMADSCRTGLIRQLSDLRAKKPSLGRAIGVVHRPDNERRSHYFETSISDQFHAVIHLDLTRAVEPHEGNAEWATGEMPETYPVGL